MGKRFRSGGRRKPSKHFNIAVEVLAGFDPQPAGKRTQKTMSEKPAPAKKAVNDPKPLPKAPPAATFSDKPTIVAGATMPSPVSVGAPSKDKKRVQTPPPAKSKSQSRAFAPFEWMLSFRYLRAKRKESFASIISVISFIGIMLGVAILITVMAVMNGFRTDIMSRALGLNGHMDVLHVGGPIEDYDAVVTRIKTVDGVQHAMPLIEDNTMMVKRGALNGALVRGIREDDLKALDMVAGNIEQGSLDTFGQKSSIVLGDVAARIYGLGIGDRLTLMAARGPATPFGTVPQQKSFKVRAIFHVGERSTDSGLIFMPLEQAQQFFKLPGHVNKIDVRVESPDSIDQYRLPVQSAAGASFTLVDWRGKNAWLHGALQMERNVMFMILAMILVIAAMNIISGLIMLVKDKGRDIAVLRTMGATRGAILRIFLISGASIGVTGTVAGFGLGLLLCNNIEEIRQGLSYLLQQDLFPSEVYFLDKMSAEINNGEVMSVLIFSLALSLLAPLYPAWRAARLDPVEALRYE